MPVTAELSADGKQIIITADLEPATPSFSGKSACVASTRGGMKTGIVVKGANVIINLNAYIPMKALGK